MRTKFQYSIFDMTKRLFHMAAPAKKQLTVSTFASIIGNLSQMGIIASCTARSYTAQGASPQGAQAPLGRSDALSAVLIVLCRYTEGVVSHAGDTLLAQMRIHLFEVIRRLAPACLIDREKGDILNIAVSDIERIEFFFAHTIGPMCNWAYWVAVHHAHHGAAHPADLRRSAAAHLPHHLLLSRSSPLCVSAVPSAHATVSALA